MTTTPTAPEAVKLGPGTLTLGETGSLMEVSCLLENGAVAWDVDTGDDINVLCGKTVAGSRTYTATFSGTFLQDLTDSDGLVAYTWAHKGESVAITFVPNDEAGATVTGTVVINPLDVGTTDDYGSVMTSDVEYDFVGEPELSWGSSNGNGTRSATTSTSSTSSSSSSGSSSGTAA